MIDFNYAKDAFDNYVNGYDKNEKNLIKIGHTYNVVKLSRMIANSLNLSEEDVLLAELIALLHDISRFEQFKQFGTFFDEKSFDHGTIGSQMLLGNSFIRNFIKDDQYDDIIIKAVYNHNKYQIEGGLDKRTLLHCKIIRDSDKLDILDQYSKYKIDDEVFLSYKENSISDYVMSCFEGKKSIDRKKVDTRINRFLSLFALIYDFYFKFSLEYIREKEFLYKLISVVEASDSKENINYEKLEEIKKLLDTYILAKIK